MLVTIWPFTETGVVAELTLEARFPLSLLISSHADDFGGAECVEAVDQCDADLDFSGLAVGVSCGHAFAKCLQAAHLRLDPAPGVVSGPAFPEGSAIVPGGAQGFVAGDCCRAVLFPTPSVLPDQVDRSGLPVDPSRACKHALPGSG
jgi:hypothetical protein